MVPSTSAQYARTLSDSRVPYCTLQSDPLQYSRVPYCTVYSTVGYHTVQYSRTLYSTARPFLQCVLCDLKTCDLERASRSYTVRTVTCARAALHGVPAACASA